MTIDRATVEQQVEPFIEKVREERKTKKSRKVEKYYYGNVAGSILYSGSKGKVLFTQRNFLKNSWHTSPMLQSFVTRCTVAEFARQYPDLYRYGTEDFFRYIEYWNLRRDMRAFIEKENILNFQIFEVERDQLLGDE